MLDFGAGGENINSIKFNDDNTCFICATSRGVRIYNVDPCIELYRNLHLGPIRSAVLLRRSNLIFLVAGKSNKEYGPNVALCLDIYTNNIVMDSAFLSDVLATRVTRNRLLVILRDRVCVIGFSGNPIKLFEIQTAPNTEAICEVTPHHTNRGTTPCIAACLGKQENTLQFYDLSSDNPKRHTSSEKKSLTAGPIIRIAISSDGDMVAATSDTGTMIRLFSIKRGEVLREFRRGMNPALISCLAFSCNDEYLCLTSSSTTVHIFATKNFDLNSAVVPIPGVSYVASAFTGKANELKSCAAFEMGKDGTGSVCAFTELPNSPNQVNLCIVGLDGVQRVLSVKNMQDGRVVVGNFSADHLPSLSRCS